MGEGNYSHNILKTHLTWRLTMSRNDKNSPSNNNHQVPEYPDQDLGIRYPYIPANDMDDWSQDQSDWMWPDGSSYDLSDPTTSFLG